MASIQVGYTNVLENATAITASSLTNYDTSRLYDRDFGKLWICSSSTAPQHIIINQSTNPITTNCLVIPKHNTSGITYTLAYGSDGVSYSTLDSWTQSGTALIKRTLSSTTANYWRLSHTSGTGTLILSEIFLTNLITFTAQPLYGSNTKKSYCVKRTDTYTGKVNYMSFSTSRRTLNYNLIVGSADKTYWQNVLIYYSNYGPFFFVDHDGNNLFVELTEDLIFQPVGPNHYSLNIKLQEVVI